MVKDFDTWNIQKKIIEEKPDRNFYREREVWWCSLGLNIGHEEDGKGHNKERPVLVLKAFSKKVCLVIPLTTSKKVNPYYIPIGKIMGQQSVALVSQLRLVDIKRFSNRIHVLDGDTFEIIRKTVKDML